MEKLHSEKGWKRWILNIFPKKAGRRVWSMVSGFIKQTIFPATMWELKSPKKLSFILSLPSWEYWTLNVFAGFVTFSKLWMPRVVFCPVPELPTTTVLHLFGQLTNYPILALVLVHYSSKSGVSEDLDNKWFFPAIVALPNNNPFWSFHTDWFALSH